MTLLGLVMGSFCTVLVYRIPREIPLGLFKNQRSQCPHCNALIPWYWNLPLLAYVFNRGQARCCKAKISWMYPVVEILTALGFATTYAVYQSHSTLEDPLVYYMEMFKLLYFTLVLVAVIFIDLEFRIIPDRFSLGSWAIALFAAVFWGQPDWMSSMIGSALGFGLFFLLAWAYEKIKGIEGLGFGDVKMMGWLGAWLGFQSVPFIILSASMTGIFAGLIMMRKSKEGLKTALPFGPFLAISAYVAWIVQSLGLVLE